MILFKWDPNKNNINIIKHGVGFEEASSVFFDENALLINDDAHSGDEERFVIIGVSYRGNLLVVCHCYRENDEIIRIISARKATKRELQYYLEG